MQLGPWQSRDDEKRKLVIKVKSLERALDTHRKSRRDLEKQLKQYDFELKEANEEINKLKKENEELRRQRDRYRDMTFKPNKKSSDKLKENGEESSSSSDNKTKRKRGGQKGHKGVGRKTPPEVDRVQRVYLTHCPICSDPLNRSDSTQTHTVEDIPPIEEYQKSVVRYETELQWCSSCQKLVKGTTDGVIPKSRLGLNVLLYVLIHKYFVRSTWERIVDSLYQWYGIKVSKGGLVKMMHRAKQWLGVRYDQLLEEIRKSPVKHADETSWRVNGLNHWLWGFFTNKHAYYLIDESRGKGIPQKILNSPHPQDVLVRDDYGSYQKIPLKHQSCWAHLLRKSKEEASDPNASPEVKKLHNQLKRIFSSLNKIVHKPFNTDKRKLAFEQFENKIQYLIDTEYENDDAKRIQTRIANQNTNLITALLFPDVPLTNNLAERCLRPMVVTRKISGGSRSDEGAHTHAVNMSILQTIQMQNQPIIPTLKKNLLSHFSKTE